MSKLVVHMSMSVDGFIAGPKPAPNNPLGDHGQTLHDWFFKNQKSDYNRYFDKEIRRTGAIIIGRVMYDESLPWWDGKGPLGDDTPCFVLTEKGSEPTKAGAIFTFVSDGIEKALELAKEVANGKDIGIGGGANTIQQYLKAGLVDELNIHLVPILLGGGTSLFGSLGGFVELEKVTTTDEPDVTHIAYRPKYIRLS